MGTSKRDSGKAEIATVGIQFSLPWVGQIPLDQSPEYARD